MKKKTSVFLFLKEMHPCRFFFILVAIGVASYAQQARGGEPATIVPVPVPETEAAFNNYNEGNYRAATKLGSARLLAEPGNHELRYIVANSYAWTGLLSEAEANYKALAGTSFASQADLGLANVYRWNGLHGLAEPLYQQVLAVDPGNKDAVEGLTYSMRELRTQTQVRGIWASDSLDTRRKGAAITQRWTGLSNRHTFEVELGTIEDTRNALRIDQRDLTFRYVGTAQSFKPRIEISGQQLPRNSIFVSGEIYIPNTPVLIGAGRVNWGKLAFDPNALQANLWANRISIHVRAPTGLGSWSMNYYNSRISDSNVVQDANLQFTPAWQPFKVPEVKIFVGLEGRKARFNSPSYWSPRDGNYLGSIGFNAEWQDTSWSKNIQLQYSVPAGGEATTSYSANAGVKRWIGNNLAIAINIATQKSQRSGAYRASSALVSIEGLW